MIYLKTRIRMPEYIKESIKALVGNISDKDLDVVIRKHQEEKTDNQRKYFWALVGEIRMAMKHGTTENDVYLSILRDHGVSEWIALPEDQMCIAKSYYRIVEDKGSTVLRTPSGKELEVRQLKCWKGLSSYTTEEACVLIDGAIEECKALGINTDTPEEIARMKEQWGVDIG